MDNELRRPLKLLSTAIHLDSGAAVALVHEALQLFIPILQYTALADASLGG